VLFRSTRSLLFRGKMMVNLLKQDRNKPLTTYQQLMMFFVSNTKFFQEKVASNPEINVDRYFAHLFIYLRVVTVMLPIKISLEKQPSADSVLLTDLLEAHLGYFLEMEAAGGKNAPLFAGLYEDTVDSGLKSSASLDEFKE